MGREPISEIKINHTMSTNLETVSATSTVYNMWQQVSHSKRVQ